MTDAVLLTALIFLAALLYSSVGHAGASGYLAVMAFFNLAPAEMRPTALILNLVVASVGSIQFARAGCFSWNVFWPFAMFSVPCAFIGGFWKLPDGVYKIVLGLVLLFAAWRLAFSQSAHTSQETKPIQLLRAMLFGAPIGFLSGLVGVGGGIFLSPVLLLSGWASTRITAGVSVVFILMNSASGLLGTFCAGKSISVLPKMAWWIPAVLRGGLIGSSLGSRRLAPMMMRRLLAVVLVIASTDQIWRGVKMLMVK